jgi:hypothetical protein
MNLFVATLLQAFFNLIISLDLEIYNGEDRESLTALSKIVIKKFYFNLLINFIINSFYFKVGFCHFIKALTEYATVCMFAWMLIEGIYLNVLLTCSIFGAEKRRMIVSFYLFGWGI